MNFLQHTRSPSLGGAQPIDGDLTAYANAADAAARRALIGAASSADADALIEREGLRFDGTAQDTMTNGGIPAVRTGDFYCAQVVRSYAVDNGNVWGGSGGFVIFGLNPILIGIDAVETILSTSTSIGITAPRLIEVWRTGGVLYVAVDGTITDSVACNSDVTGSILGLQRYGTDKGNLSTSRASFWNYAPTTAERSALTRRGLVTLPEQRGGSMVALNTSAFTNINMSSFSGASATGFTSSSTGNLFAQSNPVIASKVGQRFLATFTATITGGVIQIYLNQGSTILNIGNGVNSLVLTATANGSGAVIFNQVSTGTLVVSGFSIIPLGTLFEQDSGQRNAGYMVGDTSGNKLHLELPATGVSIVDPSNVGTINYSRASDGWIIGDRQVIPTGHVIDFILLRVTSGTATAYLGSTAGASDIVSSRTLTTSWTKVLDPVESSTGKVHLTRSTGTVEIQIVTRLV